MPHDILAPGRWCRSNSFPKPDEGDRTLFEKTLPALMTLEPDFCSVTYGAGGSTRDKTLGITERIQKEHGLTAMAHLTCVNATTLFKRAKLLVPVGISKPVEHPQQCRTFWKQRKAILQPLFWGHL